MRPPEVVAPILLCDRDGQLFARMMPDRAALAVNIYLDEWRPDLIAGGPPIKISRVFRVGYWKSARRAEPDLLWIETGTEPDLAAAACHWLDAAGALDPRSAGGAS